MRKLILLLLLPLFSFAQKDEPCAYPTLQQVTNCGNETTSSILVGALQSLGDINIGNGNGTIELYNNGNIICRDASGEACIFIVASDGTISMRNMLTTNTNAEIELRYRGNTTTTATFDYKSQFETVAYRSDITDAINSLILNAPYYPNDSTAGANGLITNMLYKSIEGTDVYLKVKQ